jgi:hypothetical protein
MQKTVLLALLLCLFWGEAKAGQFSWKTVLFSRF